MFDGRMRLTDAQYYGAVWSSVASKRFYWIQCSLQMKMLRKQRQLVLVVPLCLWFLRLCLASFAVSNFINFLKGEDVVNMAFIDPFKGFVDANVYK